MDSTATTSVCISMMVRYMEGSLLEPVPLTPMMDGAHVQHTIAGPSKFLKSGPA